jgi:hypothetical protein
LSSTLPPDFVGILLMCRALAGHDETWVTSNDKPC